ncbi:MAG: DUF3572 domain-containing protein [Pseudomonadota bacterium]
MTREMAEQSALGALAWLIGNDELVPVFLGATGVSEADLRARAAEPDFLASVMDFLLMDDAWVISCAQNFNWPPEHLAEIRAALPGGDLPNWT